MVQCGSAGHNVRSKPSMKGTPVGRLAKGNMIEALEEVGGACTGVWSGWRVVCSIKKGEVTNSFHYLHNATHH